MRPAEERMAVSWFPRTTGMRYLCISSEISFENRYCRLRSPAQITWSTPRSSFSAVSRAVTSQWMSEMMPIFK